LFFCEIKVKNISLTKVVVFFSTNKCLKERIFTKVFEV
jgi:hypothetical protein